MEENMRELGVKFNCISLRPKSRAPCVENISRPSTRASCCQDGGKKLRNAPACTENYIYDEDEDTCGCSDEDQIFPTTGCNENFYYSEEDSENIEWENESREKLKNHRKSSHLVPKPGYHRYQTQRKENSRRECANKHRRNTLRTQLSHLLRKIKPTPENCVADSRETRPEPEILAEVLLMSELEGADLSSLSPGNIFTKVFAELCDSPSYTSSSKLPEDKESPKKIEEAISQIEFNGGENMKPALNDPVDDINEEYLDMTQYPNLPPPRPKKKSPGISPPLFRSTPTQSTEDLPKKNQWPSKHECTRIQVNGTVKPVWFPGYVVISSVRPNYVRITANPEMALSEIWRLCRPQNISPASKFILT